MHIYIYITYREREGAQEPPRPPLPASVNTVYRLKKVWNRYDADGNQVLSVRHLKNTEPTTASTDAALDDRGRRCRASCLDDDWKKWNMQKPLRRREGISHLPGVTRRGGV